MQKECRICFEQEKENENENDNENNQLISPCLCNGTSKFVHIECLETWRKINKDGPGFYKCMECRYKYNFRYRFPKEKNIYHDVTYKKIMYFLYCFSLLISILLNLSKTKGQLLFLLDFGQTNKSKDICYQIYNNSKYCHSTSLYGALQTTDYFTYTIFNISVLISYQLLFSTIFYLYKNKLLFYIKPILYLYYNPNKSSNKYIGLIKKFNTNLYHSKLKGKYLLTNFILLF